MRTIDEVAIAIDACTFNSDYIYGDKEEREQLDAHGAVLRAYRDEVIEACKDAYAKWCGEVSEGNEPFVGALNALDALKAEEGGR